MRKIKPKAFIRRSVASLLLAGAHLAVATCPEQYGVLCTPSSPEMKETAPNTFQAEFETSEGNFIIEATRSWAPAEVDRFYNLVKHGYYDNTRIYRVIPGFVAQFGPSGDMNLANVYNPTICDVPDACFRSSPVIASNLQGYVTFSAEGVEDTCKNTNNAALICDEATAGTGPLVLATELFINYADNAYLDPSGFGAFGKVAGDGMTVVNKFYSGYGEMHGGSLGDYLCTRDMAKEHYPNAACAGPNPDMLYSMDGGNAYYDAEFPLLTKILKARLVDSNAMAAAPEATAAADAHAATGATAEPHATADAHGTADAHATSAGDHAADAHSGGSGLTPPENPEWPTSDGVGSVMIGMSILGVLVLAGAAGILAALWMGAKRRNAAGDASETEFQSQSQYGMDNNESAISMGGFTEK